MAGALLAAKSANVSIYGSYLFDYRVAGRPASVYTRGTGMVCEFAVRGPNLRLDHRVELIDFAEVPRQPGVIHAMYVLPRRPATGLAHPVLGSL